jgi:methyl-accepting chemotaxis protein
MQDDDEITNPGTPDALRTMRDIQRDVRTILQRLTHVCNALDKLEHANNETRARADAAVKRAAEAAEKARFSEKRVDALVGRVQRVENGQR